MKKTLAAILSLIISFGTLVSCGKKSEPETNTPEVTANAQTFEDPDEEEVVIYKRDLKPIDLKDVNIVSCPETNMIYSYGGVDFCSVYRKDNKGTPGFYAITADKEILLTDQKIEPDFSIVNNKIYYYEILEKVTVTDPQTSDYDKVAVWVMDLDGSNKKKLYDSEYKEIKALYADEKYLYFESWDLINSDNDLIIPALRRYNFSTKKTETIFNDAGNCEYHSGKIFFEKYKKYHENDDTSEQFLCIYDLKNEKITDTGLRTDYTFIDDDTYLFLKDGKKHLYSLSQNKELDADIFLNANILSWDRYVTIEYYSEENYEYTDTYLYCGNGKTKKLPEPQYPDCTLERILNEDEQIYYYQVSENDMDENSKIKYQIIYMKDGKEYIIAESDWLEPHNSDGEYVLSTHVGEFVAITQFTDSGEYYSMRY